jgi:hypothetical protein
MKVWIAAATLCALAHPAHAQEFVVAILTPSNVCAPQHEYREVPLVARRSGSEQANSAIAAIIRDMRRSEARNVRADLVATPQTRGFLGPQ